MGIILRGKKFSFMLEIDIFRNYPQYNLGVLTGDLKSLRVLVAKRCTDALLAKTKALTKSVSMPQSTAVIYITSTYTLSITPSRNLQKLLVFPTE